MYNNLFFKIIRSQEFNVHVATHYESDTTLNGELTVHWASPLFSPFHLSSR